MRDPRIQQTLNQVSRNFEHVSDSARAGCFAFTQSYLEPCFGSIAACCPSPQKLCPCCYTDISHSRRRRNRNSNRPEYPFDFYNSDYDEDQNTGDFLGWGNDELDRLLAGSGAHRQRLDASDGRSGAVPTRNEGMYYTRGGQRRRRKTLPHDGVDPTIIPNTSALGFLSIFGWRPTLRYRPSAADLQDNPGGYGGVGGAFADHDGDSSEHEALLGDEHNRNDRGKGPSTPSKRIKDGQRNGRNRSGTNSSNDTTDTFRSRADLIGSDDDADAVPLDDEFADAFALVGSGPSSRKNLHRLARRTRTNESDSLSARTSGQRSTSSGGTGLAGRRTPLSDRFKIEDEADDESGASISISGPMSDEELRLEEEVAQQEEEEEIRQKRLAANKLAMKKGLSAPRPSGDRSDSNPSSILGGAGAAAVIASSITSPITPPNEQEQHQQQQQVNRFSSAALVGSPEQLQSEIIPQQIHPETILEARESESPEGPAAPETPIELETEPSTPAPPLSATLLANDEASSGSESDDEEEEEEDIRSPPSELAESEHSEEEEEDENDNEDDKHDDNVEPNNENDARLKVHEQEYQPPSNISRSAASLNRLRFDRFISQTFSAAADAEAVVHLASSDSESSPPQQNLQNLFRPSETLSKSNSEPVLSTSFLASFMGIHKPEQSGNNENGNGSVTTTIGKPELPKLITPDDEYDSDSSEDDDDDDVTEIEGGRKKLDSPISVRSMPPPTSASSDMLSSLRGGGKTVVDGNIHSTITTTTTGPVALLGVTTTTTASNGGVWGRLGSWFSPASVAAAQSYLLNTTTQATSSLPKEIEEEKEDDDEEGGFSGLISRRRSDAGASGGGGWESMDDEEGVVERWKETMEVWTEDEDDGEGQFEKKEKVIHHHHHRSPKSRRRKGSDGKQGGKSSNATTTSTVAAAAVHGHNTFPFRYSPRKKKVGRTPLPGMLRKMAAEGGSGHVIVESVANTGNGGMITGSPEDDLD